jgi:hypothetical protein
MRNEPLVQHDVLLLPPVFLFLALPALTMLNKQIHLLKQRTPLSVSLRHHLLEAAHIFSREDIIVYTGNQAERQLAPRAVYVCVCMCACIYIYIYIYIYMCVCFHVRVFMCVWTCVYACVWLCICMYLCVCACVCMVGWMGKYLCR